MIPSVTEKVQLPGSVDHPQPVHRQPRHLRPVALHLHYAPHPDGPPHHVLATGKGYGEQAKDAEY